MQHFANPLRSRTLTAVAAVLLFLGGSSVLEAANQFVSKGATGNGNSAETPRGDLQAAIDACASSGGGEVRVSAGTYVPQSSPNGGASPHFALKNGVRVRGGFAQGYTGLSGQPNPAVHKTILSGDVNDNDQDLDGDGFLDPTTLSDNRQRVFYHPNDVSLDGTARLEGVVISGGRATGGNGGGIYNGINSSPTILACTFLNNSSTQSGGAFYKVGPYTNPAPILNRCTFSKNQAEQGGAIFINSTEPNLVLLNCSLYANSATGIGGGVYLDGAIATYHCTFVNNRANTLGGGRFEADVVNCIFSGNQSAPGTPQLAAPFVRNSILHGETASLGQDNIDADPKLLPLGNYGTSSTSVGTMTFALRGDSPAINAGFNTGLSDATVDQRGFAREGIPDIGASEYRRSSIYYVKPGGSGNGSSWANAAGSIVNVMPSSPPTRVAEIWVAKGIYREGFIDLRNNISIYGGFQGNETSITQRDIAQNPTILSGDMLGNDSVTGYDFPATPSIQDNAPRIFQNHSAAANCLVDGLIIQSATESSVRVDSGSPVFLDCEFRCTMGHAIWRSGTSAPYLIGCTFENDYRGQPTILDVGEGADNVLSVMNCTFHSTIEDSREAIYKTGSGGLKVIHSTFALNYQVAIESYWSTGPAPIIQNCVVWGNLPFSAFDLNSSQATAHCIIETTGNQSQNPRLLTFEKYGGNTRTAPIGAGSHAINFGNRHLEAPATDQRGFLRDVTPDAGATEWQPSLAFLLVEEALPITLGSRAKLRIRSESITSDSMTWDWFRGAVGNTEAPVAVAVGARYETAPLTEVTSFWARNLSSPNLQVGITLEVYQPRVIHVRTNGNNANDGLSWNQAVRDIQHAINLAAPGEHVWVAAGKYVGPFNIDKSISVYGGFSGVETRIDQRDIANYPTIFSGDVQGNDRYEQGYGFVLESKTFDNLSTILLGWNSDCTLDGVTFQGARSTALRLFGGAPTVSNCEFRHNKQAGLQIENGSPKISNCSFSYNTEVVIHLGGDFQAQFTNCTFAHNIQIPGYPLIVASSYGTGVFENCTFSGRLESPVFDGGVVTIRNCIAWGHGEATTPFYGQGLTVENSIVEGGYSAGTNILSSDPLLLPLGFYGGATQTMPVRVGSPAINAGIATENTPYHDQRDFVRNANPDLGACEWQSNLVFIRSEESTHLPVGTQTTLTLVSESLDVSEFEWEWFQGMQGDTAAPLTESTWPQYATGPLTQGSNIWVRTTSGETTFQAGISLSVFQPRVLYVSTTGNNANSGASWGDALQTIAAAVSGANHGDHIWIKTGTYFETVNLSKDLSIYGGFAGSEQRIDQRNIIENPTILNGDVARNDQIYDGVGFLEDSTLSDNLYALLNAYDSNVRVDGLTLTSAEMAVLCYSAELTLSQCTFRQNRYAALHHYEGSVSVSNSAFLYHTNSVIQGDYGSILIRNSTCAHTSTPPGEPIFYAGSASLLLQNSTLSLSPGQLLMDAYGPRTLRRCIVWGNGNSSPFGSATVNVSDCVVEGGVPGGTNIITTDPLLLPLGYYGGSTLTMPVFLGSPAIDAGVQTLDDLYFDQRMFARDSLPDYGACEWQPELVFVQTEALGSFVPGSRALLTLVSESMDVEAVQWNWYSGPVGDTSLPLRLLSGPRYATPPLLQSGTVWVRGNIVSAPEASVDLRVAQPPVVYVRPNGSDTNDGRSWNQALQTLGAAVVRCSSGDHIWVAAGTYREELNLYLYDLSVYGGFSGIETRIDQRDIAANPTILSGDILGDDSLTVDGFLDASTTSDNLFGLLSCYESIIRLDGFTFTGGRLSAAYLTHSMLSMRNCTFQYNISGIEVNDSTVRMDRCTFTRQSGPDIASWTGTASEISNCTFSHSGATPGVSMIQENEGARSTIKNCTFTLIPGNQVLESSGSETTLQRSVVWGNGGTPAINAPLGLLVQDCIIQGGHIGGVNILINDPLLLPLHYYGGATQTTPVFAGSPVINAGSEALDFPYFDQRGFERDASPDFGACEFGMGVVQLLGSAPVFPAPIGSSASMQVYTDTSNPTYQWYYGNSGDTSAPVQGGTSNTIDLSALESGVSLWVRITLPGGGFMDTEAWEFGIRGSYEEWCDFHELVGTERGTTASPASDGISNLVKFALGLSPLSSANLSERMETEYDPSGSRLLQRWRTSKTPTDIEVIFESSDDLTGWSTLDVSRTLEQEDASGQLWEVSAPISAAAKKRFLRLNVVSRSIAPSNVTSQDTNQQRHD